jgi:hypothetical protein
VSGAYAWCYQRLLIESGSENDEILQLNDQFRLIEECRMVDAGHGMQVEDSMQDVKYSRCCAEADPQLSSRWSAAAHL